MLTLYQCILAGVCSSFAPYKRIRSLERVGDAPSSHLHSLLPSRLRSATADSGAGARVQLRHQGLKLGVTPAGDGVQQLQHGGTQPCTGGTRRRMRPCLSARGSAVSYSSLPHTGNPDRAQQFP